MRNILMATVAVFAIAGAASAQSGDYGAAGNMIGSFDYSNTTNNHSSYGSINNNYGFGANGVGRDLSAGAGVGVGSGASQGTTSNALRNGSSVSFAGAANHAVTGSLAGAGAGFIGGVGSVFDDTIGLGAGLAGAGAGGVSGTGVAGASYAGNVSHGAADGTASAAQGSFGNSNANAGVKLFEVDQRFDSYEYGSTNEWNNTVDTTTTTNLNLTGGLFANTPVFYDYNY